MGIGDIDLSLYVITDADVSGGRLHGEVVRLALEGGATVIQYRDKRASIRMMLDVGRQLRELTAQFDAALVVNDRPDLALVLGADGVHLGPEDLPPDVVREIVGDRVLVSASVDNAEDAQLAEQQGADYIIARPVFPTRWKTDARPVMGSEGLAAIVRSVGIPVLGDGGINGENLDEVLATGAAGAAVTRAVIGSEDPAAAARQLRARIAARRARSPALS